MSYIWASTGECTWTEENNWKLNEFAIDGNDQNDKLSTLRVTNCSLPQALYVCCHIERCMLTFQTVTEETEQALRTKSLRIAFDRKKSMKISCDMPHCITLPCTVWPVHLAHKYRPISHLLHFKYWFSLFSIYDFENLKRLIAILLF